MHEITPTFIFQLANSIFLIIIVSLPSAALIFLQIHLSKKENKWYGLILPILTGLLSALCILGAAAFVLSNASESPLGALSFCLLLVILLNIPTIGLLLIYRFCRKKRLPKTEMNKINIQDVE